MDVHIRESPLISQHATIVMSQRRYRDDLLIVDFPVPMTNAEY